MPANFNQQPLASVVIHELSLCKFPLYNEKDLQEAIYKQLVAKRFPAVREYPLDNNNIVDIFIQGTAIEIKIHAPARAIYKQCARYCGFECVKCLILITNRAMGFPKEINGKPCYVLNLGKAWL
jgi:hypothetical protein